MDKEATEQEPLTIGMARCLDNDDNLQLLPSQEEESAVNAEARIWAVSVCVRVAPWGTEL